MRYDDLLNVPYKHGGRDKDGFDCYGLVMECCRRNRTPLRDFFKDIEELDASEVNDYIDKGLNVREIDAPKVGCIVEMNYHGRAHVGFLVARNIVLHATTNHGAKTTPLGAVRTTGFYEVTE
ncbi:MAG: C40 family peptidase [Lachnospiraceae bacterium]|nr:C40 family peptidase [Lachnospiraceae bacterium]MCM1232059.1 C40 family peptidase [Ruminococcus flavefaciens]